MYEAGLTTHYVPHAFLDSVQAALEALGPSRAADFAEVASTLDAVQANAGPKPHGENIYRQGALTIEHDFCYQQVPFYPKFPCKNPSRLNFPGLCQEAVCSIWRTLLRTSPIRLLFNVLAFIAGGSTREKILPAGTIASKLLPISDLHFGQHQPSVGAILTSLQGVVQNEQASSSGKEGPGASGAASSFLDAANEVLQALQR